MSNWTAAVLLVGTGAGAVALAHSAVPVATPAVPAGWAGGTTHAGAHAVTHGANGPQVSQSVATTSASGVTATAPTGPAPGAAVTNGASAPQVSHSVATTSASGVTTTTTTRIVNGRTVVTQVRHVPGYIDN